MKKPLFLLLFASLATVYGQNPVINVIPQPVEIQQSAGSFILTGNSTIGFNSQESRKIAEMLARKLNLPTGFSIKPQIEIAGTIQLNLANMPIAQIGKEGYTLESSLKRVVITANTPAGLFYGVQTLLQLLPNEIESKTVVDMTWTIPSVNITDYPRFGWRGMMLDVSRNFFTKDEVKRYIDQIAKYKFNTFHWHLSDDNGWRVEIRSLPKLTETGAWRVPRFGQFGERTEPKPGEAATSGGFYTQSDIKEIVEYAQDRYITILPEIDIPGHSMSAIAAYPELSCTKDPDTKVNAGSSFSQWFNDGTYKMLVDNTLNPSDEKVYDFLDKVFTELATLFPNQYFHAGGDECYKEYWTKDSACVALMKKMNMTKAEELQAYFMKRVEAILKSKGKKMIGWDEILEGGLAPEATVMSWRGTKGGIEAAKLGHNVVMAPTDFAYLDYQQGDQSIEPLIYGNLRLKKCYSFNPVPEGVDPKYILGGQGNLWTEQIATLRHAEYMAWPRGWALAEDFWSPDTLKNWAGFISRVEKQFDRYDIEGVNYSRAIYDPVINVRIKDRKLSIMMDSEVPGLDIYYTIDGSMPGIYSPKYTVPVDIPEGPVSLRVITFRNGKQIGHLITLKPEDLEKRKTNLQAQTLKDPESHTVALPNGWKLTPVGKMLPLGDLPLNIAVSPSKKLAAVTNNGESDQTIQLVDIDNEIILDSIIIKKAWLGLTFSDNGKYLYASGGNDNIIIRYAITNNKLSVSDSIVIGKPWPVKISVAGIALDDNKNRLYAVTKENNSLYVLDTQTKKVVSHFQLDGEGYTCLLSPDHKLLYISCWGCDKIVLFDTEKQKISGSVKVGDNPNDLCITGKGEYLYVANANDNSVSVIDTKQQKVIETLNSALYPDSPAGSTTNSVALSDDDKTLYIANADNNCLAVFDVSKPLSAVSKGFIPTGWYPTCVKLANDKILVSNGKGLSSYANPFGPNPTRKGEEVVYRAAGKEQKIKEQYIGGLLRGALQILRIPDQNQMSLYSTSVFHNTPYNKNTELSSEGVAGNPIPMKVGDKSPIKYVFYIIKENRTYDQVLGDITEGNGDRNLVLFGENITPNQHALAHEFVLLDNFYVNGEVSADGHNWTMGAYATDYLEKNWPTNYGGRGGEYPGEGSIKIANNKNGFLWDNCKRNGVTYRTYAEFMGDKEPNIPVLKDHFCPRYTSWDLSVRDTVRFGQWKHDFDSLLAVNALPQLNTLRFGNDHTEGLSRNRPTPFAHVADNDLAVGLFVDYLSHSKIWKNSLILIVEDDAQDGPDHVDAHRSPVYIAGGFVKKGYVDHTAYTTASLLRTMELILGLPPMSQYDAPATPLWRCMNNNPDHPVFNVKPCNIDLNLKNLAENQWQKKSEKFDFTKEDMVSDVEFNEVIWKAVKGIDSPCPPAVHAAFFTPENKKDTDD